MKFFSPAKINLFLNVLGKRADGYHELWTLFERISLGDDITLKTAGKSVRLRTSSPNVPKGPENLVCKAAELIRNECGVKKGVAITLKKRIPVAAGLGGGSSNAATVLMGLDRLWKLRLPKKKLLKLAVKLGSDVPFFVLETPLALGSGRGERLKPLPGFKRKLWHVLIKPSFEISTKQAYSRLLGQRLTPKKSDVRMTVRSIETGDPEPLRGLLTNSLELVLNKRLKTISGIKKKLVSEGAFASLMSGSGSAVFGLFSSEKIAKRAAKNLEKKNGSWRVFVVSTY